MRQMVKCWIEHREPGVHKVDVVDYELSATCPFCNLMSVLRFDEMTMIWSATCKHQTGLMLRNNKHPQFAFDDRRK